MERFWTRIGEAHAERSAGLELELLQARAGLRDMPVEEFWARKEQGDTAETALRDGLEKTLEQLAEGGPEQAAGLRDKLRSLVDALPEDLLLPSRLGEGVKEILDTSDAGTPAHRLRDDVRSLLEDTSGEWDSLTSLLDGAETEVRIARTEGLDSVPQGDAVWAVGLKESYTHHSGEQGMPEGEIAYWNTRLDEALASGDREAAVGVARDWHFRFKQFETVETLTGQARDAGQDGVTQASWREKLTGALRHEDLAEFTTLEAQWRREITAAKSESEFWQSVDETAGGLKDKAERIGMTGQEWAGFEERIVKARTDGDIPALLRTV
ncbi:hypothetical protein, partial [Streptomyces sp. NPDC056632]|uniref:hypothetical protein n=1 Tax=Streptomyces sp. NPDC056632 TaxID=3345884 RepID=UPI0036962482